MTENKLSQPRKLTEAHEPVAAAEPQANALNTFAGLRGTGNKQFTTEQVMCMTRGDDWKATDRW